LGVYLGGVSSSQGGVEEEFILEKKGPWEFLFHRERKCHRVHREGKILPSLESVGFF